MEEKGNASEPLLPPKRKDVKNLRRALQRRQTVTRKMVLWKKAHTDISFRPLYDSTDQTLGTGSLHVKAAAMYLNAALHGRKVTYRFEDVHSLKLHNIYFSNPWRFLFLFACLVHATLLAVEPPSSRLPDIWPRFSVLGLEFLCIIVFVLDAFLVAGVFGLHGLIKRPWVVARAVVTAFMIADFSIAAAGVRMFRFSAPLRPMQAVFKLRHLRTMLMSFFRGLRSFYAVFILVGMNIMFFGLAGFIIFPYHDAFKNIQSSLYAMLSISTSFPQVLVISDPFETYSRWSMIFFVAFQILNFLMMRMLVALAYRSFKVHSRKHHIERQSNRAWAVAAAFRTLANRDLVSEDAWVKVFKKLQRKANKEAALMLFGVVAGESSALNEEEFRELCALAQVRIFPSKFRPKLQRIVYHEYFEATVAMVIVFSFFQMYIAAVLLTMAWDIVGWVILGCYIVEFSLRILADGWRPFWSIRDNRFDFIAVALGTCLCAIDIATLFTGHLVVSKACRHISHIFVQLRLLRLLALVPDIRLIDRTLGRVMPAMVRLGFVVFSTLYFWVVFAMELFAGKLSADNPTELYVSCAWRSLDGFRLVASQWWPFRTELTFDNYFNGLNTLFDCSLMSRWVIVMEGAVCATNDYARLFFFGFHCTFSMIIIPVAVGYIIESFVSQYALAERRLAAGYTADYASRHTFKAENGELYVLERARKMSDIADGMFENDTGVQPSSVRTSTPPPKRKKRKKRSATEPPPAQELQLSGAHSDHSADGPSVDSHLTEVQPIEEEEGSLQLSIKEEELTQVAEEGESEESEEGGLWQMSRD